MACENNQKPPVLEADFDSFTNLRYKCTEYSYLSPNSTKLLWNASTWLLVPNFLETSTDSSQLSMEISICFVLPEPHGFCRKFVVSVQNYETSVLLESGWMHNSSSSFGEHLRTSRTEVQPKTKISTQLYGSWEFNYFSYSECL